MSSSIESIHLHGDINGKDMAQNTTQTNTPPFLALPRDILFLFLRYLDYTDTVSLSLTTKGLFYLNPTESSSNWPGKHCNRFIYRKLLPSQSPQQTVPPVAEEINHCPYCAHILCPPTCSSALLLDYRSGIFYPARIYPPPAVAYKEEGEDYSRSNDPLPNCKEHFTKLPPHPHKRGYTNSQIKKYQRDLKFAARKQRISQNGAYSSNPYKTIWCEHHRCPIDLIDRNFHSKTPTVGSYRFFTDLYSTEWTRVRNGLQRMSLPAGTRDIEPPEAVEIPDFKSTFLNKICPHCRLCIDPQPWIAVGEKRCRCPRHKVQIPGGSLRYPRFTDEYARYCKCESVDVKFMYIEGFTVGLPGDCRHEHDLVVAVEVAVEVEVVKAEELFRRGGGGLNGGVRRVLEVVRPREFWAAVGSRRYKGLEKSYLYEDCETCGRG
ncbi:hypothetical protein TWF481_007893 [Arthrobotrys musiformis]|uniref:F-box domain-containing protein n=1 Tax=Arthrobotrys musiformis TaxID=47236 RepID=A0AAV9W7J6_9PEZI